MAKKRCYLYTRVSTDMQVDGYSLDAQKDALEREAQHQGMKVMEVFSDEGKSGKNTSGRPEFNKMIAKIQSGNEDEIDYVLVFKLSRFGRNAADVMSNVQLMEDYGVHLYSVDDKIDSAEDSGKLIINVLASVAEMERENIRTQTMAGRIQKAKEGKWNGGQAPYGYALNDGVLAIDEEEAEIIRLIYELYVKKDMAMNQVAKWLNEHGYSKKTRQNNTYTRIATTFVKGVLDNPVYAGWIAYGRRGNEKIDGRRNEYHIVKKPEYGLYEGQHEAIIDRDTWEAARFKREQTGVQWEKKHSLEHAHVLSGLVKCPVCGAPMYGVVCRKKRKDGSYYTDMWYYRCKRRIKIEGQSCTFKTHIRQDELNAQVWACVRQAMQNMDFRETVNTATGVLDDTKELEDDLARLEAEKAKTEARKKKILGKITALDPDDDSYDALYDDLQEILRGYTQAINEAETQIRRVKIALGNSENRAQIEKKIWAMVHSIMDGTCEMTMEAEKSVMQSLLDSVEIWPVQEPDGMWVKSLIFRFPITVDGMEMNEMRFKSMAEMGSRNSLPNESHDETVVLLSRVK